MANEIIIVVLRHIEVISSNFINLSPLSWLSVRSSHVSDLRAPNRDEIAPAQKEYAFAESRHSISVYPAHGQNTINLSETFQPPFPSLCR